MTTHELQATFQRRVATLNELRDEGLLSFEQHESAIEREKDDAWFALSVMCDVENINEPMARPVAA